MREIRGQPVEVRAAEAFIADLERRGVGIALDDRAFLQAERDEARRIVGYAHRIAELPA